MYGDYDVAFLFYFFLFVYSFSKLFEYLPYPAFVGLLDNA